MCRIRRADLTATLSNDSLTDGEIRLEMFSDSLPRGSSSSSVILGETNLRRLQLVSGGVPLTTVADAGGRLAVCSDRLAQTIEGTWTARGTPVGEDLVFQLKLPMSTVASLTLRTGANTLVSSSNAMVLPPISDGMESVWRILPRSPSGLSLTCSVNPKMRDAEIIGIKAVSEYRVTDETADLSWSVSIPRSLSDSQAEFRITPPVSVSRVEIGSLTAGSWQAVDEDGGTTLHVGIPAFSSPLTVSVFGRAALPEECPVRLPIFSPVAFRSSAVGVNEPLQLRSSLIRLALPPGRVIRQLQATGLQERDVTYAGDGSQVTTFSQISADVSADLCVVVAEPVIEDAVVVERSSEDSQNKAVANVLVTATAGVVTEVQWNVPIAWRVTDVSESGTHLPLLFQVTPDSAAPDQVVLTAFLRSPLTNRSSQTLTVEMQSTESRVRSVVRPALINSARYLRRHDYVVVSAEDDNAVADIGDALRLEDVLAELPWLSTEDRERLVFPADSEPETMPSTTSGGNVYSTVDYSAETDRELVTETLRIRLQSPDSLPGQIDVTAPVGMDLRFQEAFRNTPEMTIRRLPDAGTADRELWRLEIPQSLSQERALDVTLASSRNLTDDLPAGLVTLPGTRRTGGTVRPPSADSPLQLSSETTSGRSLITDTIPYPADPPASGLKFSTVANHSSRLDVLSLGVLLPETRQGASGSEFMYRICVRNSGERRSLRFALPQQSPQQIFVNGRQAWAHPTADAFEVALPPPDDVCLIDLLTRCEESDLTAASVRLVSPRFPDADSCRVHYVVFPPAGRQFDSAVLPRSAVLGVRHSDLLLSDDDTSAAALQTSQTSVPPHLRSARGRLQLYASDLDRAVFVTMQDAADSVELRLITPDRRPTIMLFTAAIIFVVWQMRQAVFHTGLFLPAVLLLVSGFAVPHLSGDFAAAAYGFCLGTVGFAAARLLNLLFRRLSFRRSASLTVRMRRRSAFCLLVIISVLTVLSSAGFSQSGRSEAILVPHGQQGNFPLVYVPDDVFEKIDGANRLGEADCFVVHSEMDVSLDSPDSAVLTIHLLTAVDPHRPAKLKIPLSGVTLADCFLDGERRLPSRTIPDEAVLEIPPSAVFRVPGLREESDRAETAESTGPAVPGPDVYGHLNLRRVRYVVRTRVMQSALWERRLTCPLHSTPKLKVSLSDQTGLVSMAALGSLAPVDLPSSGRCEFETEQVVKTADLFLRLKPPTSSDEPSKVTAFVRAVVTSTQVHLQTHYRLPPGGSHLRPVEILLPPGRRVSRVETVSGEAVSWSAADSRLIVRIASAGEEDRQFIVHQTLEFPVSLSHRLPIGTLCTVDGQRAGRVIIAAGTSEQFVIGAITADGRELPDSDSPALRELTADLTASRRMDERYSVVPVAADVIDLSIHPRETTREARMNQEFIVTDKLLRWKCECQMDVRGQPVFRQLFGVPADVTVESVHARSADAPVLQSWTRSADSVIVSLHEATRGILTYDIQGTMPRPEDRELSLPVFSLPNSVETLEWTLQLSAETSSDTFLSDLAGAVPDAPLDISVTPLTERPLRMNLTDERRPPEIRSPQAGELIAESVVLLQETNGLSTASQFFRLRNTGAPFDIRLRLPGTDVVAVSASRGGQSLSLQAAGSTRMIPRAAQAAEETILKFSNLPVTGSAGSLIVGLPEFLCETEFVSVRSFDLRPQFRTASAQENLPEWVMTAGADVRTDADTPATAALINTEADFAAHRVRLLPSGRVRDQKEISSVKGGVLMQAIHQVRFRDGESVSGRTSLPVFGLQSGDTIDVGIPAALQVTAVRINDQLVPIVFRDSDHLIITPAAERFCHVQFDRLATAIDSAVADGLPLPSSGHRAFVLIDAQQPAEVISAERLSSEQWLAALSSAMEEGLRQSGPAPEHPVVLSEEALPVLPSAVWQQLMQQSSNASASFARTLDTVNAESSAVSAVFRTQSGEAVIRRQPESLPSPLSMVSAVAAFGMLVSSAASRRRRQKTAAADNRSLTTDEERTVVTASGAETGTN
ncbi:MAG: hypothetical protein KDA89_11450 [Planctomycetaceae bacterium]|nr:hypothetical protein [Planctomycetaceae bacterium]